MDARLLHAISRVGVAVDEPGVERIEAAGLQAICTAPGSQADAPDAEWAAAAVQRHDAAVRSAFRRGPVLPIRFGTMMERDAVAAMLAAHRPQLEAALERIEGMEEWGVKLFCDGGELARLAASGSEEVRRLDDEIGGSTPGRAFLLKRQRAAALEEAVAQRREALASDCRARLLANALAASDLAPPRIAEARNDEMLANMAFLVPSAQADTFAAAADALTAQEAGVTLELSGPWPPYSFVELDLDAGSGVEPAA